MKKEELKEFMEMILKQANEKLVENGGLMSTAFILHDNNKVVMVGMTFDSEIEKNRQVKIIKLMSNDVHAHAVCTVLDSWYVEAEDNRGLDVEPRKHPMRKECILITGECEEGHSIIIQKFERMSDDGKDKIILGKREDGDTVSYLRFEFGIAKDFKNKTIQIVERK